jgi:hypothetical protein
MERIIETSNDLLTAMENVLHDRDTIIEKLRSERNNDKMRADQIQALWNRVATLEAELVQEKAKATLQESRAREAEYLLDHYMKTPTGYSNLSLNDLFSTGKRDRDVEPEDDIVNDDSPMAKRRLRFIVD